MNDKGRENLIIEEALDFIIKSEKKNTTPELMAKFAIDYSKDKIFNLERQLSDERSWRNKMTILTRTLIREIEKRVPMFFNKDEKLFDTVGDMKLMLPTIKKAS